MSNRLLVPKKDRTLVRPDGRPLSAPALVVKRRVLFYRGLWAGPDDFRGKVLVEERGGDLRWLDLKDLTDDGWDGQAATAMFQLTHLVGFGVVASSVVPGSQTFTSNGTHVVSEYNRLEVAVWGGGGPGGGTSDGTNGNNSSYVSSTPVNGNGGTRGHVTVNGGGTPGSAAGGTASGGTTNTSGDAGTQRPGIAPGSGGNAGSNTGTILGTLTGGAGAPGVDGAGGAAGTAPGGGGSGVDSGGSNNTGGGGGGGGLAVKLWNFGDAGAPAAAASITATVGAQRAGTGGGGNGARGEIRAQWD